MEAPALPVPPDAGRGFSFPARDYRSLDGNETAQRARLLRERKIDAGMQPYPLSYEAEAQGLGNLGPVADIVPDQFTAMIVDESWARANRVTLVGFMRP